MTVSPQANPNDPVAILKELVAIPSVNPMGRDVSGSEFFEGRLTEWLVAWFQKHRMPCEVVEVAPGRANVLTRIEPTSPGRTLLLDAHQDTVPVDGMTIPPFEPTEREGRVYGRGACDVKGGLAAMLAAVTQLFLERPAGLPEIVLSLTCDEEATSLGINHLVGSWQGTAPAYRFCPRKPDVAIIAEPTLLDIVVAHRGAVRWQIRTTGRACHSSRPAEGINAIYRMARVLGCLETYAARLPDSRPAHRLCGPATLSVGLISGGSSVNVVPDGCVIDIDRRLLPGEDSMRARDEVIEHLRKELDFELIHEPPYCRSAGLSDDLNASLAEELNRAIFRVVGSRSVIGVPFGTHASRVAAAGVPSVVFGPGDIAQAHTKDEWIEIGQLLSSVHILREFCLQRTAK